MAVADRQRPASYYFALPSTALKALTAVRPYRASMFAWTAPGMATGVPQSLVAKLLCTTVAR